MTRVLVTGFEPFGGANVNASQQLVEALAAEPPPEVELATAVLPVIWRRAGEELVRLLESEQPELVVCFGQADGRAHLEIERFALNLDDGTDEADEQRRAEIDPDGPVAYRSSLRSTRRWTRFVRRGSRRRPPATPAASSATTSSTS